MKKIVPPILAITLVSAFPVLFLYLNNADEMRLSEIWAPLGLFVLIGLGLFAVSLVFVRNLSKAAIISSVFMLIFSNYMLIQTGIQNIFPQLGYQHILPILLFVAGHIVWRIGRHLNRDSASNIALVLAIVFGGLTLLNVVIGIPGIVKTMSAEQAIKKEQDKQAEGKVETGKELPNFYYLIFDEYSNFDIIQKYYSFDNSAFGSYLENEKFNVSYDSVNDSSHTFTILGNIFELDYKFNDSTSTIELEQARKDSNLRRTLEQNGYDVLGLGLTFNHMSIPLVTGDQAGGESKATTMGGEDFMTLLLQNTAAGPLLPKDDGNAERQVLLDVVNYFADASNYKKHENNTAFISYLKTPHQPFVFKEDGSENDLMNWHNWVDPQQYLGQYIYVTQCIEQIVSNIIKNDPNAIIVLQSDHSARSKQDESGKFLISMQDRRHHLNAVYYQGKPVDEIEGQSGLNTIRIVFSKMLEKEFPVLEVPNSGNE